MLTNFTSMKSEGHIMNMLEKLRESCFLPLVFSATGGMGPLLRLLLGSWPLCWLRSAASIIVNVLFGKDVGFAFLYFGLLLCVCSIIVLLIMVLYRMKGRLYSGLPAV